MYIHQPHWIFIHICNTAYIVTVSSPAPVTVSSPAHVRIAVTEIEQVVDFSRHSHMFYNYGKAVFVYNKLLFNPKLPCAAKPIMVVKLYRQVQPLATLASLHTAHRAPP